METAVVRISVIIPTRNRPDDLRRCLAGLTECAQRLASTPGTVLHEVVVIDDASTRPDALSPVHASDLPEVVLYNRERMGAGSSRARAVSAASGDVLAFLDDDAVPRGDWLTVAGSVTEQRPAITGRVLRFDTGLVSSARQARYDDRYRSLSAGDPVGFFAGGNSAVLASAFESVGGFSRSGVGGDNSLAEALAGNDRPVRFEPELVIAHRNGKGMRRAILDSWSSGRDHGQALTIPSAIQFVRASGLGDSPAVRGFNRVLGVVHAAGRMGVRQGSSRSTGRVPSPGSAPERSRIPDCPDIDAVVVNR
ncbi:glycosyltransferase family 2 protein [Nocardia abscessus]|uniref:glycosyltransferase family 2 protein n=1 Tax=Nocardia abscessus TaxID=120957 RepID=UPI00189609E9|nr:glycosyltransferase family 2 protein [Nocardia abscessus]MBF6337190.1 glycosyltransferase family 2 protein [Nocardia abscessus]